MSLPPIFGIDFSSSPNRKKPIVVAGGKLVVATGASGQQATVCAKTLTRLESLDEFSQWLQAPGPWLGGFDLPFALPREFLQSARWPHANWSEHMKHIQSLTRAQMVSQFKAFCDARPVGRKFAHRACDKPAGSSPSMKWVNPPVAYMLHAGATRLCDAGVHIPRLNETASQKVALEAYPGFFARAVIGTGSYKSDNVAKQDKARFEQRKKLIAAMEDGRNPLSLAMQFDALIKDQALNDASGDCIDACICLMQAAWGLQRREQGYGLPRLIDCVEGWIVSVPLISENL